MRLQVEDCSFRLLNFQVIRERKEALQLNNKAASELTEDDLLLGKKKRLAFLDLLIEASKEGTLLSDQELQEEVNTFLFGVMRWMERIVRSRAY